MRARIGGATAREESAAGATIVALDYNPAMGECDFAPDPAGEMRAFRSATSVDMLVCPAMGHMHNSAGTRALTWRRIDLVGEWCAAVEAG